MYRCEVCRKVVGPHIPSKLLFTYRESPKHKGYEIASQTMVCDECFEALKSDKRYNPPVLEDRP